MKKRRDSFLGFHFDYHAKPEYGVQGATLKEENIREICRTLKPDFIQIDCKGHPGWASYPSKIACAACFVSSLAVIFPFCIAISPSTVEDNSLSTALMSNSLFTSAIP